MNLKCNIKRVRWEKRVTQEELSNLTDISISQISEYENNKVLPTALNLWKIATALKCKVDDLYSLKD